jgi:hypothetical protein
MRVIKVEQGSSEWMSFREGKRTGTSIGKLFAKSRVTGELYDTDKPLITFYQKVAERLAEGTGDDDGLESSRERGKDLEEEAINEAEQKLGLTLIRGNVWQDSDDPNHIESPDAYTKDLKTAVEIKCLSSARHIQAICLNEPPKEYYAEYLNYFLVNDKLETLYVFLYDPRFLMEHLKWHAFEIKRADVEYDIERMRDIDSQAEQMISAMVENLIKGEI